MNKERIGFVGVGLMGEGMATNLVTKGWPLTVLGHRNREPVGRLKALGAAEAADAKDLAGRSDIVILCVTGSPQVRAVVAGLAEAEKPLLVVDCSTSDPAVTIALAAELAPRGITLIDAPLARTPKEAREGTLDIMLGGDEGTVARIRPVLEAVARKIVHTGPTGSGHTMKLIGNFLSLGYGALYSEALALGAKGGVTPEVFDSVIRGGRMDCGFYQTFMEWTLRGDREAHKFAIANGLKDMTYLAGFAQSVGLVNLMGSAVRNSYAVAVAAGRGEEHVPMLPDAIAALNGVALAKPKG